MKKMLRTLFAVLALTLCLCLPAFAQEAKPAQPAAKEDKTVTDLTGRDAFLRDVKGFTTNFGGPYVFEQASRKSPADIYGAAPAEGSVAVLRIYTMSDDKGDASINASGHAFVSVTNVSDSDIAVGGLLIAPGKSLTIGTRGNRNEHSGIWYELESYYMYYIPDYYYHLYAMQTSLDADQLAVLNAFAVPPLKVGDRTVAVQAAAEAPGPGEAYVRFSAQWVDSRPGYVDENTAPESGGGVPRMENYTLKVGGTPPADKGKD